MSIRNKIICALFMCAFIVYSFRTVSVDVSTANPATKTATWLSYLDPRSWSWWQRAAALASLYGIMVAYQSHLDRKGLEKERQAKAVKNAADQAYVHYVKSQLQESQKQSKHNLYMLLHRITQMALMPDEEGKIDVNRLRYEVENAKKHMIESLLLLVGGGEEEKQKKTDELSKKYLSELIKEYDQHLDKILEKQLRIKEQTFLHVLEIIERTDNPQQLFGLKEKFAPEELDKKYRELVASANPNQAIDPATKRRAEEAVKKLNIAKQDFLKGNELVISQSPEDQTEEFKLDINAIGRIIAKRIAISDFGDENIDLDYSEDTGETLSLGDKIKTKAEIETKRNAVQKGVIEDFNDLGGFYFEDTQPIIQAFEKNLKKTGLITGLRNMIIAMRDNMSKSGVDDPVFNAYIIILKTWITDLEKNGYQEAVRNEVFHKLKNVAAPLAITYEQPAT